MSISEDKISSLIQSQFPDFYRTDGPDFVAFVKAYYEWLEQTNNVLYHSRKLYDYRDVDKTIDDFLVYFKNKYLVDFPFTTTADKRSIIKKSLEIYRAKGSEQALKLVLRLLFDEEVDVYYPGDDVIKPSDGVYTRPTYLELSPNERTKTFVGKDLTGLTSGAKAFVESVKRRFYRGGYIDQVFLTNIRGDFITGEFVTADGIQENNPIVTGSLDTIEIVTAGRDFVVGEPVSLVSTRTGRKGRALVSNTGFATGQIIFEIDDGGFGFVRKTSVEPGSDVYIANNMFGYSNVINANTSITNFTLLERVVQYKTRYTYSLSNLWVGSAPAVGDLVIGGNSSSNSATGYIASITSNNQSVITSKENVFSTNGTIIDRLYAYVGPNVVFSATDANTTGDYISIANNPFVNDEIVIYSTSNTVITNLTNNQFYYVVSANSTALSLSTSSGGAAVNLHTGGAGNSHNLYGAAIANHSGFSTAVNVSSYGYVTGQNSTHIGFHSLSGENFNGFYNSVGIQNNYIKGLTSNTYAQLGRKYSGTGANFEVGVLTNEERVYVATDFVGGNNYSDGAAGPGIPYLNIKINANTADPAFANGYNSKVGSVFSVSVVNSGTGYVNSDVVTVSGGDATSNAVLSITTDASGNIISSSVTTTGYGYNSKPTITVTSGTGSGANLQAVMTYGYGFPKLPYGSFGTIIDNCLTRQVINVGTIALLSEVNTGEQYNIDPFVYVIEPRIAGFGRKDLRLYLTNVSKPFSNGEYVNQNYYIDGHSFTYSGYTAGKYIANVSVVGTGFGYSNGDLLIFSNSAGTGAVANIATTESNTITSTFSATAANTTSDKIEIASHPFVNDHVVVYRVATGNTAVGNLTSNTVYFVVNTTSNDFSLASTANGTPIDLIAGGAGNSHTITLTGLVANVTVVFGGKGYTSNVAAAMASGNASFTIGLANANFSNTEQIYQQQYRTTIAIGSWTGSTPAVGTAIEGYDSTGPTLIANNGVVLLTNATHVIVGSVSNTYSNNSINVLVANGSTNATPTSNTVATANIYAQILNITSPITANGIITVAFRANEYESNTAAPKRGVNAFNDGATIYGVTSVATANVSYANAAEPILVSNNTTLVVGKGQVISYTPGAGSTGVLDLKRLNFNLSFAAGIGITGNTSGATANIAYIQNVPNSRPIGLNANVVANTSVANGTLVSIRFTDNGLGYQQDEIVTIIPEGTDRYVATARVNLGKQGTAEGGFKNTRGFLNSDKYIHDNDYYQEFSYEVRAGLSLDKYSSVLKQVLHVAGTKYFGNVFKISPNIDQNANVAQANVALTKYFNVTTVSSTTDFITFNNVISNTTLAFVNNDIVYYLRETGNTADIGLTSYSEYVVHTANSTGVKLAYSNSAIVQLTPSANAETGHSLTKVI